MHIGTVRRVSAIGLCIALLLSFAGVYGTDAGGEYPLISGGYVRLLGRGEIIGEESRTFNWPNAGFEFEFSGTKAEVYVDQVTLSSNVVNGSYFNAAVYDGDVLVRVSRLRLVAGWNTIFEAQAGDPETKKIMLVRSSEACKGTLRMSKLRCDAVPKASAQRPRLIEFIGDSYTAGYGNSPELSEATYYCAQNTDNWNSYTGIVARCYNADNNVIAYQGKGLYANRSLTALTDTMADQFEYEEIYVASASENMSTRAPHRFEEYQPQLVTIWLGTNDAAAPVENATFETAYINFLDTVREKYPNAAILNMALRGSRYCDIIQSVVNAESRGEKNGYYMLVLNPFTTTSLGHPDIAEDHRIADQIIEKLDSISGLWDVPAGGEDDTPLLSLRADYNTGEISAWGNTGSVSDSVSALVTKPGAILSGAEKEDIAYVDQISTNAAGEYMFDFKVDRLAGIYTFYLNSTSLNDLQEKEFTFKNLIPTMTVTSNGKAVETMADLSAERDLTVTLSGFDVGEDGFKGALIVAQYQDERLCDIVFADASNDTQAYGTEVILSVDIKPAADNIKVFYLNQETIAPVTGVYSIV